MIVLRSPTESGISGLWNWVVAATLLIDDCVWEEWWMIEMKTNGGGDGDVIKMMDDDGDDDDDSDGDGDDDGDEDDCGE